MKDISNIRNEDELPPEMKNYIKFINENVGAPIRFVSNGPGRDQIVTTTM
jgi:adenylosuccinate synthase